MFLKNSVGETSKYWLSLILLSILLGYFLLKINMLFVPQLAMYISQYYKGRLFTIHIVLKNVLIRYNLLSEWQKKKKKIQCQQCICIDYILASIFCICKKILPQNYGVYILAAFTQHWKKIFRHIIVNTFNVKHYSCNIDVLSLSITNQVFKY